MLQSHRQIQADFLVQPNSTILNPPLRQRSTFNADQAGEQTAVCWQPALAEQRYGAGLIARLTADIRRR